MGATSACDTRVPSHAPYCYHPVMEKDSQNASLAVLALIPWGLG